MAITEAGIIFLAQFVGYFWSLYILAGGVFGAAQNLYWKKAVAYFLLFLFSYLVGFVTMIYTVASNSYFTILFTVQSAGFVLGFFFSLALVFFYMQQMLAGKLYNPTEPAKE